MATKLEHDFIQMMNRNKDGSESTKAARRYTLKMLAKQLRSDGFTQLRAAGIKTKHINHLVERWKSEGLSSGTLKNRMAHVRWLAEKIGKPHMLKSNDALGIERRSYVPETTKAKELDQSKFTQITDQRVALSLRLQEQFGLRKEESIKFSPKIAVHGDKLALKASWCKGGRYREIPVRTSEQKALLADIRQLVGNGALIPANKTYKQQMKTYEYLCSKVGLDKNHGLRHQYAQSRYLGITGNPCSLAGGQKRGEMSEEQREIDRAARMIISHELGHGREDVTAIYLGS